MSSDEARSRCGVGRPARAVRDRDRPCFRDPPPASAAAGPAAPRAARQPVIRVRVGAPQRQAGRPVRWGFGIAQRKLQMRDS